MTPQSEPNAPALPPRRSKRLPKWNLKPRRIQPSGHLAIDIVEEGGGVVALVRGIDEDELRRRAILLANAPELLTALRAMASAYAKLTRGSDPVLDMATNILALAEGQL